ncbi:MAG: hypothetical protein QOF60_1496 [Actinomycetota bacterium]|jgi:uncharacterized membrane protein|nr:hypothetical protein [Actinomycetota bacterium]
MSRRWRVAVAALVVVVAVAVPQAAQAKAFRVSAVQVEATLRPDASMRVVEHLTYDFEGEFHNGTRPIPAGDYEIVDVGVTDHDTGEPLPFEGAPYNLTWHYTAVDERRTFDVAYTVLGAAKVGPDVGELFWKFVGELHPGVGEVRVELGVPGDGVDVRAWAHGPSNGRIEIQGSRVLLSVTGVPAGEFVEARVTVPADQFTVAPQGDAKLPGVLATEQRQADEANHLRQRELDADKRRQRVADALGAGFWIVPLAGWAIFLWLFRRYGKEYPAPPEVGEYVREPPTDPPAFLPTLFAWGTVQPVALSATIVDLAQRGHLTIEETRQDRLILADKVDWKLTRKQQDEPLRPFEQAVLRQLFVDGPETTQSDFADWCRNHRTDAMRWWQDVQAKVKADFAERKYIEGGKGVAYALNILAGLAVVIAGVGAVGAGAPIGVLGIVSGAGQLAATISLRRRTPAGRTRLAEWTAFRRFLTDFSQLADAPVGHLILWERYLVYAVALGVSSEVARALAARIPPPEQGAVAFAPWFIGMHGPGALDSVGSFSGFANDFGPHIVAAATPPRSSSSGSGFGGGGFSGGGGGGGGGGGIGAS